MNFYLSNPPQFAHLKIWFEENKHAIPHTLDTDHAYFMDLKYTIEMNIYRIENDLKINGRPKAIGRASKNSLITIYNGLKVKDNWNKPMANIEKRGYLTSKPTN